MNSAAWVFPDMELSSCLDVALFSSVIIQGIFHMSGEILTQTQKVSVIHSPHQSLSLWKEHRATFIMKILTSHKAAINLPLSLQSTSVVHKWWGWWTGEWATVAVLLGHTEMGVSTAFLSSTPTMPFLSPWCPGRSVACCLPVLFYWVSFPNVLSFSIFCWFECCLLRDGVLTGVSSFLTAYILSGKNHLSISPATTQ